MLANVVVPTLLNKPLLLINDVRPPVNRELLANVAVATLLNKPLLLINDVTPPVNSTLLEKVVVEVTRIVPFRSKLKDGELQLMPTRP